VHFVREWHKADIRASRLLSRKMTIGPIPPIALL
jgi:hypothetical protein